VTAWLGRHETACMTLRPLISRGRDWLQADVIERRLVTTGSRSRCRRRRCHCKEPSCRLRCLMHSSSPGIDRAAEVHALCVPTAAGEITAEFTIAHSSGGIASPMRRLARYGDPGGLLVAIERSDGRLAGLLLEPGTRWSRSSQPRSRPGAKASPPPPSLTPAMDQAPLPARLRNAVRGRPALPSGNSSG
jgi:hypothetical protein